MAVVQVPMFRVVCDQEGCDRSPQDDGEFYAWATEDAAEAEGEGADWIIRPGLHLCEDHGYRTVCMGADQECPRRDVTEADDGWVYCPDHLAEGQDDGP